MHKRMTLMDASFVLGERRHSPQHGAILLIFKPPRDAPENYLGREVERLRSYPVTAEPFNYLLTRGLGGLVAPSWTVLPAERIELDYHFRHSALPQPGGELELATLVSRLVSHPLDMRRPLWEAHLIEGLADNRFAILIKAHHAMLDGVRALKLLRTWLSEDPGDRNAPPLWSTMAATSTTTSRTRTTVSAQLRAIPGVLQSAVRTARDVQGGLKADYRALRGLDHDLVAPYTAPQSIFNGPITQRRRVSTQRLDLERMRAIADAIDGTLNDAIALVVATALRRYLLELDALPERALIGGVLTSLRHTLDPAASERAGNAISMLFADLATDVDNVVERARRITISTRAGKEHLLGLRSSASAYSTLMLAPFVAGGMMGKGHRVKPLLNIGLSNVPGLALPVFHNGAEAESLHATTIIDNGSALVITVTSWNRHLAFTITGCPDTVPSCQRISVYLLDALEEVAHALAV